MEVIGHHRSLYLAERHRRQLERSTGTLWAIVRRQRADGKDSLWGHTFTFRSSDVYEWIVSFSYDLTGRSFDVIVTARDESEAFTVAREFLSKDVQGQRIVKAGFRGWQADVAKGVRSDEEAGEAEYRLKSRR